MATEHGTDKTIAQKLARVARMHFSRQRLAAVGPSLPARQDLFNKLLASKAIEKAVEDEARSKKISHEKAQQNAIALMEEIAADFSYETVRLSDRVLSWTWNRLYQGINVTNAERVRQLAQDGHEIVYVPCHRSHMDYLLLSYVLYHQGLVPPHIAAGINLNFWPAGPIFRRLGAFFIRRTFKGNKLYSTVFREYLGELFTRGYSVEYFVEGGRSRTGRLLEPKTGTLSMTIQAMLRGGTRPITLVPIYIGYEHVMEVGTYAKELRGATKEKESLPQMLRGLRKAAQPGPGLRQLRRTAAVDGLPQPERAAVARVDRSDRSPAPKLADADGQRSGRPDHGAHQQRRRGQRHEPVFHRAAGLASAFADPRAADRTARVLPAADAQRALRA